MVLPVSGLKDCKKIIARQMVFQLNQNNFFNNLWDERQVWHGSIVLHIICVAPRLLQEWRYIACLNWGETIPVEREALTINVINETRSSRYCLVMEVGIGSSMQLFVGDFKMSSRISSSIVGSNWESCGPSKMAKVGDSHERESRIRWILSEKKLQNLSGRSQRGPGMSDRRGAVLDLPNSSLETAKRCLQEELESIFSQ